MSEAGQGKGESSRGEQARRQVRRFRDGALATRSHKLEGYPYASALPFCTDQRGRIVLLISHLAEHTRNAEQDARASFLVYASGPQLQQQARVSQMGDLAPVEDPEVRRRYLRFFPQASGLLDIGGFRFYRLEPKSARYIAGFGSIHDVAAASYLAPELPIAAAEDDILDHMNREHAHNLADYCRHVHGVQAQDATMVGIDCDGFDVLAGESILRFDFEGVAADAGQARSHLVALAKASRD